MGNIIPYVVLGVVSAAGALLVRNRMVTERSHNFHHEEYEREQKQEEQNTKAELEKIIRIRKEKEKKQKEEQKKKAELEERIRKENETKKKQMLSREKKRLESPVCPKKKRCSTNSCDEKSCFLCSDCNAYFCNKCHNSTTADNDGSVNSQKLRKNLNCSSCKMEESIQEFIDCSYHVYCVNNEKADHHDYDCFLKTCKHVFHKKCWKMAHYLDKLEKKCIECRTEFTENDVSEDFFDPALPLDKY